jgi:hypothetical protein
VAARIADGVARRQRIAAVVLDCLLELLPLDDARRDEYRVTHAFVSRCLDHPTLAAVAGATIADIRGRLAVAVENGKECGEVEPALDPHLAAIRITALTSGLADQLYLHPAAPVGDRTMREAAEMVLRTCLDGIFTGECRQYRR